MAKTTKTVAAKKAPKALAKAAAKAPGKASAKAPAKAAVKKPAAKAVKLAAGSTVSLKQIAAGLAESHEMPKRQVEGMLNDLVDTFAGHLKKGIKIRMNGLGIFQVRARPARMGRNPATGAQIQIKASKKIAFRPAKELKDSI